MDDQDAATTVLAARYPLPSRAWPEPLPVPDPDRLRDLYRGCLLWGAVGDALGRPVETRSPSDVRARFGPLGPTEYVPWRGWRRGPVGTITDDTQLTIEVARCYVEGGGRFDPEDFGRRLLAWLPIGRGVGRATRAAVENLARGMPWWEAGVPVHSAGNGAAMRAAPIGLVHALRPTLAELGRDAVLSSVPTHTHPVGVAGAVAIAAGVAFCVRGALADRRPLDPPAFIDWVAGALDGLEAEPTPERRPGGRSVRLAERLREIPAYLEWGDPLAVLGELHNGGFALESVPAAIYCFLRAPDDPREVIQTAVRGGYDADTVAAMAGNLVGARVGAARLRADAPSWWEGLEYRDDLIALGDALAEIVLTRGPRAG
jgi:ADP-ribosylglycohydrolase